MPGTRISDLPRALWLRLKHGDWRGLYTLPTQVDPEQLSDAARATLARADQEVRQRQNEILGTQHLLLGVLHPGGDEVGDLFAAAGHERGKVAAQVRESIPRGDTTWDEPRPVQSDEVPSRPRFVGMTRRAVEAQERAFKLAEKRRTTSVTPALLLEALLADRHSTAARLLNEMKIDTRRLINRQV